MTREASVWQASWKTIQRVSLGPSQHSIVLRALSETSQHSNVLRGLRETSQHCIILRGLRWAVNCPPIMPRDSSLYVRFCSLWTDKYKYIFAVKYNFAWQIAYAVNLAEQCHIRIVFTIVNVWFVHQTPFRLVCQINQEYKNYNPNLVSVDKIQKQFL